MYSRKRAQEILQLCPEVLKELRKNENFNLSPFCLYPPTSNRLNISDEWDISFQEAVKQILRFFMTCWWPMWIWCSSFNVAENKHMRHSEDLTEKQGKVYRSFDNESQGAGEGTPEDATCRAILETDEREGRLLRGISKTNMGNHYRMNWEQLKRKRKEDPYIEEDEDLRREGLSENVTIHWRWDLRPIGTRMFYTGWKVKTMQECGYRAGAIAANAIEFKLFDEHCQISIVNRNTWFITNMMKSFRSHLRRISLPSDFTSMGLYLLQWNLPDPDFISIGLR